MSRRLLPNFIPATEQDSGPDPLAALNGATTVIFADGRAISVEPSISKPRAIIRGIVDLADRVIIAFGESAATAGAELRSIRTARPEGRLESTFYLGQIGMAVNQIHKNDEPLSNAVSRKVGPTFGHEAKSPQSKKSRWSSIFKRCLSQAANQALYH